MSLVGHLLIARVVLLPGAKHLEMLQISAPICTPNPGKNHWFILVHLSISPDNGFGVLGAAPNLEKNKNMLSRLGTEDPQRLDIV